MRFRIWSNEAPQIKADEHELVGKGADGEFEEASHEGMSLARGISRPRLNGKC